MHTAVSSFTTVRLSNIKYNYVDILHYIKRESKLPRFSIDKVNLVTGV